MRQTPDSSYKNRLKCNYSAIRLLFRALSNIFRELSIIIPSGEPRFNILVMIYWQVKVKEKIIPEAVRFAELIENGDERLF